MKTGIKIYIGYLPYIKRTFFKNVKFLKNSINWKKLLVFFMNDK